MNQYRNIQYKPIYVGLIFSLCTIVLYEFGPYYFPNKNRELLYLFLLIAHVFMFYGFRNGASTKITNYGALPFNTNRLINILFWSALLVSVPKFIIYTGFYSNVLVKIQYGVGLFFSGAADELYMNRQELGNATGIWQYINYAVILLGPLHWGYTPIAVYFWKRLSWWKRIGTFFIWLIFLLQYICTGTNVGLFEFFISVFIVIIIKKYKSNVRSRRAKRSNKSVVFLLVFLVTILLFSFDYVMGSRIGDNIEYITVGEIIVNINKSSLLWSITPDILHPVLAYFARYLAIPYYALEMSFELPFLPTFGLGHSWFVLDNLGSLSHYMWERTYQMQIEHAFNYDHWSCWHTAYLWFANDVSYFGVPIILYILFRQFGKAWKTFICTGNICSFLLFMLFVKMIVFISANNQVFQASDHLFAFWILIFLCRRSKFYVWEKK